MKTFLVAIATLGLAATFANCDDVELLGMKAKEWKYFDGKAEPKGWEGPKFDDAKWKTGQAILGYGDPGLNTEISFGDNDNAKHLCAFFRRTIDVKNPKEFKAIIAKLICDDGCVVYLN